MDTKSKNIKYSPAVRTAAFILALIFFGISGCFASAYARSLFNYNVYEGRSFTDSEIFRRTLNSYENKALYYAANSRYKTPEEYKNSGYGKQLKDAYEERKKQISNAFDVLDSSGIKVHVTESDKYRYSLQKGGTTYYFSYDGTRIEADEFNSYDYIMRYSAGEQTTMAPAGSTSAVTAPAEDVTSVSMPVRPASPGSIDEISNALNFLSNLGNDTDYGETSKEALLKREDNKYESDILDGFNSLSQELSGIPDSIKSISYAVFLNDGTVVSNCGITAEGGHSGALERFRAASVFTEEFADGNYAKYAKESSGKKASAGSLTAELSRTVGQSKSVLEIKTELTNYYPEVISAVFAYNGETEQDIIYAYNSIHERFSKSVPGRVSPTVCTAVSVSFFVLACAICVFLLITTGKTGTGEIRLLFTDKVPLLINLLFYGFLSIGAASLVFFTVALEGDESIFYHTPSELIKIICMRLNGLNGILAAVCFGALYLLISSIVRNLRAKQFCRHTLCACIIAPFRKLHRKISGRLERSYSSKSGKKRVIFAVSAVCLFALIDMIFLALAHEDGFSLIIAVLLNLAAFIIAVFTVISFCRTQEGTKRIRQGNLSEKISLNNMPFFMKEHAEDINSVGDGLQTAVDSAVKDQRMKAELITNVSHDLKTPLTSIVSYVDLLKRCNIEDEDAKNYLEILDEKSQKMKKLIEDLVEASKASSGSVELHPVKLNLCELAAQAAGENEDELKAKGIDIVLKTPENPVFIYADSQKTSRIMENLFSNIKKYALENTRAYIEVIQGMGTGIITFKNISKYELNIPAEELTARFVRGDASRSSEGSGLGLSIVNNLCRLQDGTFTITTDGDLFKAVVALPADKN